MQMKWLVLAALLVVGGRCQAQTTYKPYRVNATSAHYALFYFAINNQVMTVVMDAGDCKVAIAYGYGDTFESFQPQSCNTTSNPPYSSNEISQTAFTLDDGTTGKVNASSWSEQQRCNNHGCSWYVLPGYDVSVALN
jgi:hypothetical protein